MYIHDLVEIDNWDLYSQICKKMYSSLKMKQIYGKSTITYLLFFT